MADAVRAYSEEVSGETGSPLPVGTRIITWAGLDSDDSGSPYACVAHYPDKVVQITGTFDTTTIVIEGTLDTGDSPVYFTLTDPQGNAISKTAAAGEQILENVYKIRPRVTAGGASTDLTVKLLLTTVARR